MWWSRTAGAPGQYSCLGTRVGVSVAYAWSERVYVF
jgi:hypothetical protein